MAKAKAKLRGLGTGLGINGVLDGLGQHPTDISPSPQATPHFAHL